MSANYYSADSNSWKRPAPPLPQQHQQYTQQPSAKDDHYYANSWLAASHAGAHAGAHADAHASPNAVHHAEGHVATHSVGHSGANDGLHASGHAAHDGSANVHVSDHNVTAAATTGKEEHSFYSTAPSPSYHHHGTLGALVGAHHSVDAHHSAPLDDSASPSVGGVTGTTAGLENEESQVVPESLDHLTREELCNLVYRLDYERHNLRDKLGELRSFYASSLNTNSDTSNNNDNHAPIATPTSENHPNKKPRMSTTPYTPLLPPLPTVENALSGPHGTLDGAVAAMTNPTHADIEKVQKRMGKNCVNAIKKATHGGRKMPKSQTSEGNVSPYVVEAIMKDFEHFRVSNSKRMTKWNVTDDKAICQILKCERLIHPVKHDGRGYIFPAGGNASPMYNWARFVSLEIRYDKQDYTLQLKVKTAGAGGGKPEFVPQKVAFAKGEIDELPELDSCL